MHYDALFKALPNGSNARALPAGTAPMPICIWLQGHAHCHGQPHSQTSAGAKGPITGRRAAGSRQQAALGRPKQALGTAPAAAAALNALLARPHPLALHAPLPRRDSTPSHAATGRELPSAAAGTHARPAARRARHGIAASAASSSSATPAHRSRHQHAAVAGGSGGGRPACHRGGGACTVVARGGRAQGRQAGHGPQARGAGRGLALGGE